MISLACMTLSILIALTPSSSVLEPAKDIISSEIGTKASSSNRLPFCFASRFKVVFRSSELVVESALRLGLRLLAPSYFISSSCLLSWSFSCMSSAIRAACLAFVLVSCPSCSPFLLCISSMMPQTALIVEYCCSFSA